MNLKWWKILAIALVLYTLIGGLLLPVPKLPILHETIRNLYFHVTMWFSMVIIFIVSIIYGIKFLGSNKIEHDTIANESINVGLLLGILGLLTGSLWAKNTWGAWWTNDPQLNGAAVTMLSYLAYVILRGAIDDKHKRARISAVYSILAFTMMVVFIFILPRMNDSLHPGKGGNPGFGKYDLDNKMRVVFYPAVIGWTLLALWIMNIRVRIKNIEQKILEQ